MIKVITEQQDLEQISGGVTTIRSSFTSSRTRPVSTGEDPFEAFRARAAARRAARAEREAAREPSTSTRRGFSASAALGLP